MSDFLKLNHIYYSYKQNDTSIPVLSDITFSLEKGEFIAIVGPSGCGKSTLLNLLCGLLKPDQGTVFINGQPLGPRNPKIGYMLQKDHLFEWKSVFQNILLGPTIRKTCNSQTIKKAEDYLSKYHLTDFKYAKPSTLSGGMKQRVALIRTLLLNPSLLLLDEPFSALDYQTRLNVCDDIWAMIQAEKKSAILVTHDLSEAISMANRVIILSARPATIKKIIPLSFKTPDLSPMQTRSAPGFKEYFNLLWKELNS